LGFQYEMAPVQGIETDTIEVFFSNDLFSMGHYGWVFPRGSTYANVGVVMHKNNVLPLNETFKKFAEGKLSHVLQKAQILATTGGMIPRRLLQKTYGERLLVVGDAAGQLLYDWYGGINTAVAIGRLAGKVAAEAVALKDCSSQILKRYEDMWKAQYGKAISDSFKRRTMLEQESDNRGLDDVLEILYGGEGCETPGS
jgi:digeranylgeranylglycerophospholipid reductase